MDKQIQKLIVKTVSFTLSVLIVLTIAATLIFYAFFPKNAAQFSYNIGLDGTAAQFYYKDYKKNNNIYSLHQSLILAAATQNYALVETAFEDLSFYANYGSFITEINKNNSYVQLNPIIKSTLLNEDNYLKQAYVHALVKQDKVDKAANFAIRNFSNSVSITNQKSYVLSSFFALSNDKLNTIFNKYISEITLYEYLVNYFYTIYNVFYDEVHVQVNMTQLPYLISLGNRITLVANHIVSLDSKITHSLTINFEEIANYSNFVRFTLAEII